MNKQILMDYIDACELIRETEEDIQKLRKTEMVYDKVTGSNPEFPYQPQGFNISGVVETYLDQEHLEREKKLLKERKQRAESIKVEVEAWINTIPVRIQRIIRYKIFERNSWEQVAVRMGTNASADSVRMEYYNFMRKQK